MRIRNRVAVVAGLALGVCVSGSAALDTLLASGPLAAPWAGARSAVPAVDPVPAEPEEPRAASSPAPRAAARAVLAVAVRVAEPAAKTDAPAASAAVAAAGSEASAESSLAIALDAPQFENGTARFTGADPGGPREVVLWRVEPGASGPIARGTSRADGSLDLPVLRIPSAGFDVVASPVGQPPTGPSASAPRRLPGRELEPPQGRVIEAVGERHRLQISPLEAAGAVVLAGPDEIEFAREAIPERPDAAARQLELWIEVPADDAFVLLAHLLPDGRRSGWRPVALTRGDLADVD